MLHRAAFTPATCSVLAQVGSLQSAVPAPQVKSPAWIHARLVAARMDSQGVVHGSNGQPLRRVILTW